MSSILPEVCGKSLAVEDRKVGLGCGTHVLKSMKETIVVLRNHGTSVGAETADLECCPYGVTGEQLVVGRDTGELDHTKLHYEMVDELLSFLLCKGSVLKVSVDIDVKERGYTANGHCSTVLCLDGCKVTEVQPLNCFLSILSGSGDVVAVGLSHDLHLLQSLDLHCKLFSLTDNLVEHCAVTAVCKVFLLLLDKEVDTVKSDSSVVTYDTSTTVCIGKSRKDVGVSGSLDLGCVNGEDCVRVCCMIFSKDFV